MQYICIMSDIYPFGSECSYVSYSQNEQTEQMFKQNFQVHLALLELCILLFQTTAWQKDWSPPALHL